MDVASLFNLDGKTALVTGASRGLGRMIAEGLLSAGVTVHICAPDEAELIDARDALSTFGDCHAIVADVAESEAAERLASHVDAHGGRLDILVNNAAIARAMPFADFERKVFDEVLAVNLAGPFDISRRLAPALRAASRPGDPSRIINIASVEGMQPPAWESYPYAASKAGLILMTRHLASRLAPDITVNAIAPGLFRTAMTEPLFARTDAGAALARMVPMGREGTAEEIAGTAIYLASKAGGYLTGALIPVSGGVATADG